MNAALGNWRVSAVQHYQSGTPFGVSSGQNMFSAGSARPNYVPGQMLKNPDFNPRDPTSRYLNPLAFIQPANGIFGDVPAVIPSLRQPLQLSEDMAVSKDFPVGSLEKKKAFEFRASAFNLANRHLLGGLNTSITSSAYGQFSNPQSNQPRNIEFSLRFRY